MTLRAIRTLIPRISQSFRSIIRVISWIFGVAAFLFSVYAFYRERRAEQELEKAILRINSTTDELQKARYYIEELEGEIKKYEAENEKIDAGIDSLIRTWRAGLQKMREELD